MQNKISASWLIFLGAIVSLPLLLRAQKPEKLYYFMNPNDSLTGVKNSKGVVIIPARYSIFGNWKDLKKPIPDSMILFVHFTGNRKSMSRGWGDVYNRKGVLLYHPLSFDNGPDNYREELVRCVENNMAGFADRSGTVVIKPQWDWVSEFNYGYASVCNGCAFYREPNEEHAKIIYPEDADTFWINIKGDRVPLMNTRQHERDQKIGNLYLPYPFSNTDTEQKMVDSFNHTAIIGRIYFCHYYEVEGRSATIQFEITKRPSATSDFFVLQGYEWHEGYFSTCDKLIFEVNQEGEWFFADSYTGQRIPFKIWLKKELKLCKDFFRANPDAPNKFRTRIK